MFTVLPVEINITGAGDHVVMGGESEKWIKVFRIVLTCETAGEGGIDIQFKSGSTQLPGPLHMYDGGSITLGMERRRWVATEPGEDLVINLSDDATVKGALTVQVGP